MWHFLEQQVSKQEEMGEIDCKKGAGRGQKRKNLNTWELIGANLGRKQILIQNVRLEGAWNLLPYPILQMRKLRFREGS